MLIANEHFDDGAREVVGVAASDKVEAGPAPRTGHWVLLEDRLGLSAGDAVPAAWPSLAVHGGRAIVDALGGGPVAAASCDAVGVTPRLVRIADCPVQLQDALSNFDNGSGIINGAELSRALRHRGCSARWIVLLHLAFLVLNVLVSSVVWNRQETRDSMHALTI